MLLEVYKRARALVAAGWRQGGFAKDEEGQTTNWSSHDAVCFCALGALCRARMDLGFVGLYLDPLRNTLAGGSITFWNDYICKSQDEVLAKFDEAIATL